MKSVMTDISTAHLAQFLGSCLSNRISSANCVHPFMFVFFRWSDWIKRAIWQCDMPFWCSVITFLKVQKEFSRQAIKAVKVRAALNAVRTLVISSRPLWKLQSGVFSVHFLIICRRGPVCTREWAVRATRYHHIDTCGCTPCNQWFHCLSWLSKDRINL